jgi:hypothetical protein
METRMTPMKAHCLRWRPAVGLLLAVIGIPFQEASGAPSAFPTPEEAVRALDQAIRATNRAALAELFGPAAESLMNPDTVQGGRELADFAQAFTATNRLARVSDRRMVLEVGREAWPFPIPLVKGDRGWQFDGPAGVDELLNRRIGRNELDVLRVLRGLVDAQREYASRDRDGDDVLEFAQTIGSGPGRMDGLYWPVELNGEISPIGPFIARAQAEGYFAGSGAEGPQPFHGYYFRVLKRQGRHAPGGKYDYVINGNMIGGFALVAWPAEYGESGVMTFIVNQQGRVYQRDLGPKTTRLAKAITSYDPDSAWSISAD